MKKGIFVLSDLHIGSPEGLMPPNYVDLDGVLRMLSPKQNYLWDNYIKILDEAASRPVDMIVINGDAIDGKQKKSGDQPHLCLHLLEDQKRAAILALEEVKSRFPKATWRFVCGTPYHEGGEDVRQIAKHFTDVRPEMTYRMSVGEANVCFHHEVAFSGAFLKSAALEREIINNLLAVSMHDWKNFHVHVRSHCHYFRYVGMKDHLAIVTPCFQLQNDYGIKGSPFKNIPNLGAVYLVIDDSLLKHGMCPAGFEEFLFTHPEPECEKFEEEETLVGSVKE